MTQKPLLQEQIDQLEAMLRTIPSDSPVRESLENVLRALQQQTPPVVVAPVSPQRDANIATNLTVNNYLADDWDDPEALMRGYLDGLISMCNRLSLADADSSDPTRDAVELAAVYTRMEVASTQLLTEKGGQRSVKREQRQKLVVEVLVEHSRLVLVGDPGSGKSTCVNFVALCLAHARYGHVGWLERLGSVWKPGALLPIIVTLRSFAAWLATQEPLPIHGDGNLLLWRWLDLTYGTPLARLLRKEITSGRALLLLDGFDEVSENQERLLRLVRETIVALGDSAGASRVVVTCRELDYATTQRRMPFWHVETIIPFSGELQQEFIDYWYDVLSRLGRPLNGDPILLRNHLQQQVSTRDELRRLAGNPLLLTMMTLLHAYEGRLPAERVRLYEKCIEFLLMNWRANHGIEPLAHQLNLPQWSNSDLNRLLDRMGFVAHERGVSGDGEAGSDLPRAVMYEIARAFFANYDRENDYERAQKFGNYIKRFSNGILQEYAHDIYRFPHRTFQEYLAARRLVADDDWGEGETEFIDRALKRASAEPQWREALLLAASQQVVVGNQIRPPTDLAEALLDDHTEQTPLWTSNAILAAELLAEVGRERFGRLKAKRQALWERTVRALVSVLEQPNPLVPLTDRVRAGRALAQLGDPRFPTTTKQWLTELLPTTFGASQGYWCYIPGGMYKVGGWKDENSEDDDSRVEEVEAGAAIGLHSFWIARFPITVIQYASFITEGYSNAAQRWWTPKGWEWKGDRSKPWRWEDGRYNTENQPVIGIAWYEATAFANWCNALLSDNLPKGYVVRLPSEAEWEVAAAYTDTETRNTFPWGNEKPTIDRAIYDGTELGRPASVGCCQTGKASCGALDLAGNVWEWTASFGQDYPFDSNRRQEDFSRTASDIAVRGGSYLESGASMSCRTLGRNDALGDSLDYGFRLVIASTEHAYPDKTFGLPPLREG